MCLVREFCARNPLTEDTETLFTVLCGTISADDGPACFPQDIWKCIVNTPECGSFRGRIASTIMIDVLHPTPYDPTQVGTTMRRAACV